MTTTTNTPADTVEDETGAARMAGVIATEEALSIPNAMIAEEIVDALSDMVGDEVTTALAEVGMESIFNEVAVIAGGAVLDEAVGGLMGYFHITYSAYRGIAKEGTGRKALLRTGVILACGMAGGYAGSTTGNYLADTTCNALFEPGFIDEMAGMIGGVCGAVVGKVTAIIWANKLVDRYLR